MKLLTQAIKKKLPPLGSTAEIPLEDRVAVCKFFTPFSWWKWYVIEGSPRGTSWLLWGYVVGAEAEWGYFDLRELEELEGPFGQKIERDIDFAPKKISEIPM